MTNTKRPHAGASVKQPFRWPCPHCKEWHTSEVSAAVSVGEAVRVRCPATGRIVERPMALPLAPADRPQSKTAAPKKAGVGPKMSRIRRWLRDRVRKKKNSL